MGRFKKELVNDNGIDRRDAGYYSTPDFIAKFLTKELLRINPKGNSLLDPAVGNEELLKFFEDYNTELEIDGFDIIEHGEKKYSNFSKLDFIDFYRDKKESQFMDSSINLKYDYFIANPPYNCHEINYIKNNKTKLKKLFGPVGVHNMYSMFLSAIIDCAKEGAVIGVIISDSFLTAKMHSGLREQIIKECSIHSLILCPNDLFWSQKADVRTCILILQKGVKYQKSINLLNRPENKELLETALEKEEFTQTNIQDIILSKKKNANQFLIDVPTEIRDLFHHEKIGEKFNCITGISTGNDGKYLSKERTKGYTVPFYKNPGSKKFKTKEDAYLIDHFMEESKLVKDFMVRNKSFIFKKGITCSSMGLPFSACLLPENSTFGVNPNIFAPDEDIYWLLSYLNSHLITYLVRGVLIRSNMVTSGYVSQLPVLPFNKKEKAKLELVAKGIISESIDLKDGINQINVIIYKHLDLKEKLVQMVDDFANNLGKRV